MIRSLISALALAAVLTACGGQSQTSEEQTRAEQSSAEQSTEQITPPATPPAEAPPSDVDAALLATGETVYTQYCSACHQTDGNGVTGVFPPLTDPAWVEGDRTRLINIVLNGLQGSIEVNGQQYNQAMPPHNFLSDEQVAGVLTYVRNNFGNRADAITPEEVKAQRGA